MIILCAPDKFKDACSAREAAAALALGVADAGAQAIECPLADGGEGTLDVLAARFPKLVTVAALDPLGREIQASFRMTQDGQQALIESGRACGLALLAHSECNPMRTSTRGVGRLVRAALDAGAREILLALGGSATNDGGAGMAAELGARFFNQHGHIIEPTGGTLQAIARVDCSGLDPRLREAQITALCDVAAPLIGALDFAPQKGADVSDMPALHAGLTALAGARRDSDQHPSGKYSDAPGSGAAGGLGFGAAAFLGAQLVGGAARVLDLLDFDERVRDIDLVLTGEGSFDAQTAQGKVVCEVARRCAAAGVPCVVLAGRVDDSMLPEHAGHPGWIKGVTRAVAISPPGMAAQEALRRTTEHLRLCAAAVVRSNA